MSDINRLLRRCALCVILAPALAVFMAFSAVFLGPFALFFCWVSGSSTPLADLAHTASLPFELFAEAWDA